MSKTPLIFKAAGLAVVNKIPLENMLYIRDELTNAIGGTIAASGTVTMADIQYAGGNGWGTVMFIVQSLGLAYMAYDSVLNIKNQTLTFQGHKLLAPRL